MKNNQKKYYQQNRGAAMIIVVMFFVIISTTILIGIISPVIREYKIVKDSFDSKKSYFLAESGVEDLLYRLKNNKKTNGEKTLIIGDTEATTNITDITSDKKEIISTGDTKSLERRVKVVANTGVGVSFSYGVLAGIGGFSMDNNSKIVGSVYSNGPITGSGTITGAATSANSPDLAADQTNGAETVPPYDIKFGDTDTTQDYVQSFKVSNTVTVSKIKLYIKKVGAPSNITVHLVTNYDPWEAPSLNILTSGTLPASSISTNYGWVDVPFSTPVSLTQGIPYWIVLDTGTPSSSQYYYIAANKDFYSDGFGKLGKFGIYIWDKDSFTGKDIFFDLYSSASVSVQSNGLQNLDYDIKIGDSDSTQDFAQSFQVSKTGVASKVQLYIKKVNSPSNITVRLTTNNIDMPSSTVLTSATLPASAVSTNYGWVDVPFLTSVQLSPGVPYWIVLDGVTSASKYYYLKANMDIYLNGFGKVGQYGGSLYKTPVVGKDIFFKLYMGGITGLISGVKVGTETVGNTYAHTVNNTTISGINYCQTGTGNNKSCNTTLADPVQKAMPISEQNILDWKAEAETGGVTNGNYTVPSNMNLGPRKITGNLTINNGVTLTAGGPIWVQGNVIIDNNSLVKLNSSFGSSSGVIIADGTITVSNNAKFGGSGAAGSYMLVISTSSSSSAIQLSNNAGAVALYAANGTINVANNGGAKSINGYAIHLDNNAVITYDSGLTDLNFTSGPAGSWNIESWREIE